MNKAKGSQEMNKARWVFSILALAMLPLFVCNLELRAEEGANPAAGGNPYYDIVGSNPYYAIDWVTISPCIAPSDQVVSGDCYSECTAKNPPGCFGGTTGTTSLSDFCIEACG